MGRRGLDGWVLCSDSGSKSELGNRGEIHTETGQAKRGTEAATVMVNLDTLRSCRRVLHYMSDMPSPIPSMLGCPTR